ncbi:Sulfur oxidation Z protein [Roseovarius sp. EC-HK134]|jgi:sulfur-oxidizing protein SoxZ|uniref:Sulfur oxidation protein SoxZ n=1 Tax=Roseovarius mucosus TaxID=215743 RepID=A0A1V0RP59_9RHOB|nr:MULTISPECIES: thiosulfate oxidation carrier complex protein SoxZ [Roseovarius]MBS4009910.1 thiosulfate oxidation carrier complex protein SoxZ [Roseovarius sp.]ARE83501.1 sulfur oxidation protein SoxZ [Roseovarius mucosus]AWZ19870.1 Sulfur oxidation protein SoxZ [Roseovarius sp. AK1035]EDM30349.1 sulfur oxidation Z protein [Roseovarius sp. TM1035]MBW4973049.1 thiosulfate oxidation carrier complex protein SoxZ [Roseovarius mucosus]|tara:strand:+ start:2609 stop:2938 length:330 start_codon:yes stop_codon:yes gene_type:complete
MAQDVTPRVKVPKSAAAGEAIAIKTLISHPMESGQRKDKEGNIIPRSIINRFTCEFNGQSIVDVTMEPAISTNPYIEFAAIVPEAGEFKFTWYDDDGSVYEDIKPIELK